MLRRASNRLIFFGDCRSGKDRPLRVNLRPPLAIEVCKLRLSLKHEAHMLGSRPTMQGRGQREPLVWLNHHLHSRW